MKTWSAGLLCLATLSGCVSVNQGGRPLGSIIGQLDAPPQPGDWCRITYPQQRDGWLSVSQGEITGQIESIDEEGLHLSHVHARNMSGMPLMKRIPYVSRYFKNTGVGTMDDSVISLERAGNFEIVSKEEVWQPTSQILAQQMAAAVPGPQRIARQ